MRFRSDIEGLRAVSILLVVAYHYAPALMTGGYIGVDVFFVISGYLITLSLIDLRNADRTSLDGLATFWARRARRLLPNALLVLAVFSVVAFALLPDVALRRLGDDVTWAAAYSINWLFVLRSADYLRWGETGSSALLNYWSLAVEEQFYLAWPILLFAALPRDGGQPSRLHRARVLAAALAILSLVYCLWLAQEKLTLGFFSSPARAWELLTGAWLACHAQSAGSSSQPVGAWAGMARDGLGLTAIFGAACMFTNDSPHPGALTLVPVLGSALLIAPSPGAAASPLRRWLGSAPMRYVGARSYSVYLWHWPVLVLGRLWLPGDEVWATMLLLGSSWLLAEAAFRFVETPARIHWRCAARARSVLLLVLAASTSVALLGASLRYVAAYSVRARWWPASAVAAPGLPSLQQLREDLPVIYANGCHLGVEAVVPAVHCRFGAGATAPTILLFGDSHAAQWAPALELVAAAHGHGLLAWTKSGCPSADVSVWNAAARGLYRECDTWREAVFRQVDGLKPSLIIVSNLIDEATVVVERGSGTELHGPAAAAAFEAGLVRTLQRLRASGAQVVVIRDTPRPRRGVVACLYLKADPRQCERTRIESMASVPLDVRAAAAAGVPLWDFADWICDAQRCPVVVPDKDLVVYRDDDHLTASFVRTLAPALAQRWPSLPVHAR